MHPPLSIRAYEIERRVKTPEKYLFPCYETVNWYAAKHILDILKGEKQFVRLFSELILMSSWYDSMGMSTQWYVRSWQEGTASWTHMGPENGVAVWLMSWQKFVLNCMLMLYWIICWCLLGRTAQGVNTQWDVGSRREGMKSLKHLGLENGETTSCMVYELAGVSVVPSFSQEEICWPATPPTTWKIWRLDLSLNPRVAKPASAEPPTGLVHKDRKLVSAWDQLTSTSYWCSKDATQT